MPRGVKGSGPYAGRSKGKKATSLKDIAERSGNTQSASNGATDHSGRAALPGRGRGRGRQSAGKTSGGGRGASASGGQQRAENETTTETNGVKIETMPVPGRGGRPMQAEEFPFAALEPAEKKGDGSIVGPSFLIPEDKNPDNVLAAARKRHKGKTFMSRKMEGGVRIWRAS